MYNQLLGHKIKQILAIIMVMLSTKNTTHGCWLAKKLNSIPGLPIGWTEINELDAKMVSCWVMLNAQYCKCKEIGIRKQHVIKKITILQTMHFQLNASCINNFNHNNGPTSSWLRMYWWRLTNHPQLNSVTCFHFRMISLLSQNLVDFYHLYQFEKSVLFYQLSV